MSLTKKFLKSKPVCKVTFRIPREVSKTVKSAHLLGDFNKWNKKSLPMTKLKKDGSFALTLDLDTGQEYSFRYLLDNDIWHNDEAADKYVTTVYGDSENCIVQL